ncbi:MAG: replicative DNA helicase [Petrotogales bacterium]
MKLKQNKFIDQELEQGFIQTVLGNPEVFDDVIDQINVSVFTLKMHKKIFDKMQNQYFDNGKISRVKIMQFANQNFSKDKVNQIFESSYMAPMEIPQIADQLNKYRFKRNVKRALNESYKQLVQDDDIDIDQVKAEVQDIIFSATSEELGKELIYDVEDVVYESYDRFIERQEGKVEEKMRTGLRILDSFLSGGFSRKHLSILAGRPSMGKTAMALRILLSIMETSQVPSLFISLEMDRVKLIDRLLIQKSKVAADDFYLNEKVSERQNKAINWANDWLHEKPLKVTDKRGLTIEDIKSIFRKTDNLFDGELGFIVIDYLTEVKIQAKGRRFDKGTAEVIRDIRNLAGELDCHVLLLHQINRDFKNRKNKRPLLSDLRDTGEAEEKIDNALLLHRPAYYNSRQKGEDEPLIQTDAELNLAKQREGKTGVIDFVWYPEIIYFQQLVDYQKNGKINYLKKGD